MNRLNLIIIKRVIIP